MLYRKQHWKKENEGIEKMRWGELIVTDHKIKQN